MSLMLDSRRRAMLAEMGIKVWLPEPGPAASVADAPRESAGQVAVAAAVAPAPKAVVPSSLAANSMPAAPLVAALAVPAPALTPLAALQQAVAAEANGLDEQGQVVFVSDRHQSSQKEAIPRSNLAASEGLDAAHVAVPAMPVVPASSLAAAPIVERAPVLVAPAAAPVIAVVPSGPVAQMDWPALRQAVASCQACKLCESRKQTVFGVGAQRADWMVVGEAPGEQEDLHGEPFVGPAGQLLDAMLHAVGLNRQAAEGGQSVFIANVLKCRPPANRNPLPAEIAQCQPYLRRQVALVQPKIILAMGRFAVQALLNTTEPIGRLRQHVHSYQGVPVIVSYHPAYLLRNLPEKAKAWADLVLAMQVAQSQRDAADAQQAASPDAGAMG